MVSSPLFIKKRIVAFLAIVSVSALLLSGCTLQPNRFQNIDRYLELVDYKTAGEVTLEFGTGRNTFYADSTGVRYSIVGEDAYELLDKRSRAIDVLECEYKELEDLVGTICKSEQLKAVFEYRKDDPSKVTLQVTDSMSGETDVI